MVSMHENNGLEYNEGHNGLGEHSRIVVAVFVADVLY